ncbi:MAG: helix-turn-helix domain-containing protein [Proteobacteria bacterium]|nr:helix-turn-helix domain-containing protein [Pseudomonadota bacterium]
MRPCLRCRPESSPGTPAWLGTSATVSRALRYIREGALDRGSVDELATRLGVGARQLRRLFATHLGASPISVAQTRRLHFAVKLLDETHLDITQVAFASGFSSIRRFNAAVKETYGRPPSALRRQPRVRSTASGAPLVLRLAYREPFDWSALLAYLQPRCIPGVEEIADGRYRRTVSVDDASGVIEVACRPESSQLELRAPADLVSSLIDTTERVRRLFDLRADPAEIQGHLARDPRLRGCVRRFGGVRVPGVWSGFEFAVRAVLGQQVSVVGATTLAGRIAERFGQPVEDRGGLSRLFPTPEVLATAEVETIGLPQRRAETIRALAVAVRDRGLDFNAPTQPEPARESLVALPGIGPWTTELIALRVLREPDAFPAGDLALRKALATDDRLPTANQVADRASPWSPWRGYAAMLLWQEQAAQAGRSKPARSQPARRRARA